MKNNKTLKYTGIIQGVLIATLLLLAIWIQVTFLYNTYYCEDYSFGQSTATTRSYSFSTLFLQPLSFSSLSGNYVLYVIFEIMDIASLVLPVYLVYKSIRSKSTMANGLIIISSAVTFMIMVAYGVYTLLDIIRGAETFNIYSIIFIFIMLIKVTLCIVSLLRIRAINNAVE